jgi:DNA recombination protein RmuC
VRGEVQPLLALDAKFPVEDYDRLLLAAEAGDAEGERAARRGLEMRLRLEARKIGEKYVVPPVTVDFAVMYLPTDGLYVEAARIPGLIEMLNREHRVLVMGPSLAPALLRTILLGTLTLSIEQRAHEIQNLLGAVRAEMLKMDAALGKLATNADRMTKSVEDVRRRTRAVDRKLRSVTALETTQADAVLELEAEAEEE